MYSCFISSLLCRENRTLKAIVLLFIWNFFHSFDSAENFFFYSIHIIGPNLWCSFSFFQTFCTAIIFHLKHISALLFLDLMWLFCFWTIEEKLLRIQHGWGLSYDICCVIYLHTQIQVQYPSFIAVILLDIYEKAIWKIFQRVFLYQAGHDFFAIALRIHQTFPIAVFWWHEVPFHCQINFPCTRFFKII